MFQKPLHFDRTGVRVVAMCPGRTITNIIGDEKTFLVAEWITLTKGYVYQPYVLKHILINFKPLIQLLRKRYLNIYPCVLCVGTMLLESSSCAANAMHKLTSTDIRI